jgi:hypothetical protein
LNWWTLAVEGVFWQIEGFFAISPFNSGLAPIEWLEKLRGHQ